MTGMPLVFSIALVCVATCAADDGMFSFSMGGLEPNVGIADMSFLNEKPAGRNGFVRVDGGHFLDGCGRRIRFLGTNLAYANAFPTHDDARRLAARFASMGMNCVRIHQIDQHSAPYGIWKKGKRQDAFDPEMLDRLQFYVAELKKQGIYIDMNLHVSYDYWKGATFDDGLSSEEHVKLMPRFCKGLDKVDDRLIGIQTNYVQALLTPVNPYTGLSFKDDPVVALIEVNNENWVGCLAKKLDSMPSFWKDPLREKWNAWLKARYGDDDALALAWKEKAASTDGETPKGINVGESLTLGNVAMGGVLGVDTPRQCDWVRFLLEMECRYEDCMRKCLRQIGCRQPIIGTQADYGRIAGFRREMSSDFIDMHAYWQHPVFRGATWNPHNWDVANKPMTDIVSESVPLFRLAAYRSAGKPFTVSEYDHPAPSDYVAELFPVIASFGAVQDWDGIFQFAWGTTDDRIGGFFDLRSHPAKLAFMPSAALMFRRGDMAVAKSYAVLELPDTEDFAALHVLTDMEKEWNLSGYSVTNALSRRLAVSFSSMAERPHVSLAGHEKASIIWKDGEYRVDTLVAKVLAGRLGGRDFSLSDIKVAFGELRNVFAVLTISCVDGLRLADSHRVLVALAGRAENTNMGWNETRTSVGVKWGTAPTICDRIPAVFAISTTARSATVYALDGKGRRARTITSSLNGGQLKFASADTLWYEIEAR